MCTSNNGVSVIFAVSFVLYAPRPFNIVNHIIAMMMMYRIFFEWRVAQHFGEKAYYKMYRMVHLILLLNNCFVFLKNIYKDSKNRNTY